MGFCINPDSKRLSNTRPNGGTNHGSHRTSDAGTDSRTGLSPGPATSSRASPAVAAGRRSAATAVNQSVLPSPSSLEPYLASHSACCARRHLRSSCHSGYIHPGNRTGTNPSTATTNIANTRIVRNDLTGLFSLTPTGSANPNSPPNRKHNPNAGSITAIVLRPRLNPPSNISRASSPQSLSENIAKHQNENVNPPSKMQVIPIIISLNMAVHPKNNIISATSREYLHSLYRPAIFQDQPRWQHQPHRQPRHPPDLRRRHRQPHRPEPQPSHQQPNHPPPAVATGRRSATTAVNQSVLPSPSSLEPYLASHSACCARRHLRSSCHSGYIHPGNRTGTNPSTATTSEEKKTMPMREVTRPPFSNPNS